MKVVLITGAASGIGLALSELHLEQHDEVVMVDINAQQLHIEATRLEKKFPQQVKAFHCDISNQKEVQHLVKQTLRLDLLYNNAGIIGSLGPLWSLEPEALEKVFNVNVLGMFHMIQAFMPLFLKQEHGGHFINIASLYALCNSSYTSAYAMSKHAVLSLSESLYFDLKDLNKPIYVSVAFPSFTSTSLLANTSMESFLSYANPAEEIANHIQQEVAKKAFYIFPNEEVKEYAQRRNQSLLAQELPSLTPVEKIMKRFNKVISVL